MKHTQKIRAASHMGYSVDTSRLPRTVDRIVKALKNFGLDKFDAIAFRGMSGAIVSGCVALSINKSLIMVRKPGDKTHSGLKVEGDYNAKRYVIVDDLISSGDTVREMIDAIRREFALIYGDSAQPALVGVMLYMYNERVVPRYEFRHDYWAINFDLGPDPDVAEKINEANTCNVEDIKKSVEMMKSAAGAFSGRYQQYISLKDDGLSGLKFLPLPKIDLTNPNYFETLPVGETNESSDAGRVEIGAEQGGRAITPDVQGSGQSWAEDFGSLALDECERSFGIARSPALEVEREDRATAAAERESRP